MAEPRPAARTTPPDVGSIRRTARAARRSLTGGVRQAAQGQLLARLLGLDELRGPGCIGLYLPTDGEVDLTASVDELSSRGWQLHLPVIGPEHSMAFRPWHPGEPLTANRFGIHEPPAEERSDVTATDLDVVVGPCVAVDRTGNRVGFGAGYYDRALAGPAGRPLPHTVGVVFEVQLVDTVPARDWDVPMRVVVTESCAIRVPAG